jgi:hypothetical protein
MESWEPTKKLKKGNMTHFLETCPNAPIFHSSSIPADSIKRVEEKR